MSLQRLPSAADIAAALPAVFADQRRLPLTKVVAGLRSAKVQLPRLADDAADAVLDAVETTGFRFTYHQESDDILYAAALLDGVTLTHRLDDDEVADGGLYLAGDVAGIALDRLLGEGLLLPDGERVHEVRVDPGFGFCFPLHGALAALGLGAGDLVGVRFEADCVRLVAVAAPGSPSELLRWLRVALPETGTRDIDDVFDDALLHTTAFQQLLPPFTEVLDDHGFGRSGSEVAASPESLVQAKVQQDAEELAAEYDLTDAQAMTALRALSAADILELDPAAALDGSLLAGIGESIADPWLAFLVAEEAGGRREGLARLLERLRSDRTATADRRVRAACSYLSGRLLELAGDPLAAEEEYHKAVTAYARHTYAILRLAGIAADSGRLATAQRLLVEAGANPEYPLRRTVEVLLERQPNEVAPRGRNEPCWCGSGRKYKVCHGRAGAAVAPVDADGVMALALTWATLEDPYALPGFLQRVIVGAGDAGQEVLARVVPDILLIEGGALEDYLRRRGPLLPAEVALMARQWLLRRRSAYEVEVVRVGQGMTVRDLMTGDRVEVTDRAASEQVRQCELLFGRLANTGEHEAIFGLLTMPFEYRDSLLDLLGSDPTPPQLIDWLVGLWAEPRIMTPEGDPLIPVTGTFTTTSPAKLRRALDERLDADGGHAWNLIEPLGDGTRILATANLDGKTLEVSATSEARYERMLQVLDDLGVPLVEKEREVAPLGDAPLPEPGRMMGPEEIAADPELAEHLADYIGECERRWLDEHIPALGGATPREAAADPTRRDDLIRLLDSLPSSGSPLQMDGGRLRAALGV